MKQTFYSRMRNFLEPSVMEIGVGITLAPFLSLPIYSMTKHFTGDYTQAIPYALIPQGLIYCGMRVFETGIKGKNVARMIKSLKPSLLRRRLADRI